jgi:hypothetical protein
MVILQSIPIVLSILLIVAHFLRSASVGIAVFFLLSLGLLLIPRRWAARTLQGLLLLAALLWVSATIAIAGDRLATGQPLLRMVTILGAVTLFTAASALVFYFSAMRKRFRLKP